VSSAGGPTAGLAEKALVDRVRRRISAGRSADVVGVLREDAGLLVDDAALAELRRGIEAEISGAGPLEPLLAMPGVTDVLVNAPDEVWTDCGSGLERSTVRFADDAAVRRLAQRLASAAGRRLDDAAPFVDASLPDGTRLHAVLPPVVSHPVLSLRVLRRTRFTLGDLVAAAALPPAVAELLVAVVSARLAFVISGGTGTGKTTLLGALLGELDPSERVILVEDAAEVVTTHRHLVRLVTRQPNVEGAGTIGPRELVRQALRMRPDRLVVGEFRGAEMVELLAALNTGHEGGAATLHANAVADVPARLAALGALGGLDRASTELQVSSALEVIVQLRRGRGGRRIVAEIGLLRALAGALRADPVWTVAGRGSAAGELAALLAERGVAVPDILR
jgi:pilus assembly protein CpaF